MDWLAGFGWSGLITVTVCVVWDIYFPLNNLLIACVYISSFIAWLIFEKLSRRTRDFWHNFFSSYIEGSGTQTTPHGPIGICGFRPAKGCLFFFSWPTRCGSSGLVENRLALQAAVNGLTLQRLTCWCISTPSVPNRQKIYALARVESSPSGFQRSHRRCCCL